VLATETSAREAAAALDNASLCIRDAVDWAALAKGEAL
jgi:hypothetical protein